RLSWSRVRSPVHTLRDPAPDRSADSLELRSSRFTPHALPLTSSLPRLLNQLRHQSRPSRLMTGPDAGPVVPVKILIEEYVIAPMRIVLQSLCSAEHRTFSFGVLEKNVRQTV